MKKRSAQRLQLWLILTLILLGLVGFFFFIYQSFFAKPYIISSDELASPPSPSPTPSPTPDPLRPRYLLLLGYAGGNHDGGGLADTIIVAQIVPLAQQVNLFSLPRDLWVQLPFAKTSGGSEPWYIKLNGTLAIGNSTRQYLWRPEIYQGKNGGGRLAMAVVEKIIGQPLDYYLAVDFSGFVRIINTITGESGLKVTVPYTFIDEHYPITGEEDNLCDHSEEEVAALTATLSGEELDYQFPCRYERLEFQAGQQYLTAEQVLKFARSRHSGTGGGDFGRSQRQQVVLQAVREQLFSLSMIPKLPDLLGQIFGLAMTDVDLDLVKEALFTYQDLSDFTLESYVLSNQNYLQDARAGGGQYVLLPRAGQDDYHEIQAWVQEILHQTLSQATASSNAAE